MLKFNVSTQYLTRTDNTLVFADSQDFVQATFTFSPEWDAIENKIAKFTRGEFSRDIPITGEPINVPTEATLGEGEFEVTVFGGALATANGVTVPVYKSGLPPGQFPYEPTPGLFDQILTSARGYANDAEQSAVSATASEGVATTKATVATEQNGFAQAAAQASILAKSLAEAARDAASGSAGEALESASTAANALSDLLAMMGTDIATLDATGKLSANQLPAIALIRVVDVASEAEMVQLTPDQVQQGDVARIVVGGEIGNSYILNDADPSVLANWAQLGDGYVAEAGHALQADTAADALKINGHRLVEIAVGNWSTTVKDPETYYWVH